MAGPIFFGVIHMPPSIAFSSGFRTPGKTERKDDSSWWPSVSDLAVSSCIAIRDKVGAVLPPTPWPVLPSPQHTGAIVATNDEKLSELSASIDKLHMELSNPWSVHGFRGLLPELETEPRLQLRSQPTGGSGSPISGRWLPTETARERVAQRVEQRLAATYERAEEEAMRMRVAFSPVRLEMPASAEQQTVGPWGVSAAPHFTPDLAHGRSLGPPPDPNDIAHPGAWGTSAAPHFIPHVGGPEQASSPIAPPRGAWPAAENEPGGPSSAALAALERDADAMEQAMLQAARSVIEAGGGGDPLRPSESLTSYGASTTPALSALTGLSQGSSLSVDTSLADDPSLDVLSALTSLGTDDSPNARKAARAMCDPVGALAAGTLPAGRANSYGSAQIAGYYGSSIAQMADPERARSTAFSGTAFGSTGPFVLPAVATRGGAPPVPEPAQLAAPAMVAAPAGVRSGAMLASKLGDGGSTAAATAAAAAAESQALRRASYSIGAPQGARVAAQQPFAAFDVAKPASSTGAIGRAMPTSLPSDGTLLAALGDVAARDRSAAPNAGGLPSSAAARPAAGRATGGVDAESDEYEYYAPDEAEHASTDPAVVNLKALAAEAEAAHARLNESAIAEELALSSLELAESEIVAATGEREAVEATFEGVRKLESEISVARDQEDGLRRMVQQHEQAVEEATRQLEAVKKKRFASKAEREKAQRALEDEEAKLQHSSQNLKSSLGKVAGLLSMVEDMSVKAEESQKRLEVRQAEAQTLAEKAKAEVTQTKAMRRDAEAVVTDASAQVERERLTLLGAGKISEMEATSFHQQVERLRPNLSESFVASAFTSAGRERAQANTGPAGARYGLLRRKLSGLSNKGGLAKKTGADTTAATPSELLGEHAPTAAALSRVLNAAGAGPQLVLPSSSTTAAPPVAAPTAMPVTSAAPTAPPPAPAAPSAQSALQASAAPPAPAPPPPAPAAPGPPPPQAEPVSIAMPSPGAPLSKPAALHPQPASGCASSSQPLSIGNGGLGVASAPVVPPTGAQAKATSVAAAGAPAAAKAPGGDGGAEDEEFYSDSSADYSAYDSEYADEEGGALAQGAIASRATTGSSVY